MFDDVLDATIRKKSAARGCDYLETLITLTGNSLKFSLFFFNSFIAISVLLCDDIAIDEFDFKCVGLIPKVPRCKYNRMKSFIF